MAEELREATVELENVRNHLRLADECCEQVLQSDDFTQAVMNWQRSDERDEQVCYLSRPQSINDADAAKSRLKDMNVYLVDIVRVYVTSIDNVRSWREQADRVAADSTARQRYQTAADNEAGTTDEKRRKVLKQYAECCPYVQQFCEALFVFEKDIDDRSIDDYLECCKETMEAINETLRGAFLSEGHIIHMKSSAEFLEGMIRHLRHHQECARKTKEECEREEEREVALREQLRQQSDDDFWEEYDRRISRLPDPLERKVLLEERLRRKTKQDKESRQGSWRNQPAMAGEDPQTNQEERSRQNDINDWQAQRLLSRSALRQIVQELIDEGVNNPEKTIASGRQDE